MNEIAIKEVMDYIENDLFEPGTSWPNHIFEERSYSRWAAYEIIQRLMDRPLDPPEITIEEFIFDMESYYAITENPRIEHIFSIAADIGKNILQIVQK